MDGIIQWVPGVSLESVEKQVILAAFRFYRGNKTTTAASLGIAIRTLDNKLEQYQMDAKSEKERDDNARNERQQFLARSRGARTPSGYFANTSSLEPSSSGDAHENSARASEGKEANGESSASAAAGVRMESASVVPAKQPVSLPERKEVQAMPSPQVATGSSKHRR